MNGKMGTHLGNTQKWGHGKIPQPAIFANDINWYPRSDSNRQALRRGILNPFDCVENQQLGLFLSQEHTVNAWRKWERHHRSE